jgi:ribosomal protein S15P/S13E
MNDFLKEFPLKELQELSEDFSKRTGSGPGSVHHLYAFGTEVVALCSKVIMRKFSPLEQEKSSSPVSADGNQPGGEWPLEDLKQMLRGAEKFKRSRIQEMILISQDVHALKKRIKVLEDHIEGNNPDESSVLGLGEKVLTPQFDMRDQIYGRGM